MSLRSILGVGKVKKKTSNKPRASSAPSPSSSSSSWAASLPRTKASGSGSSSSAAPGRRKANVRHNGREEDEEDYFHDRLDDYGLVKALATDLNLRDVVQAMRYIRGRMFEEIPQAGAGMHSTKIADVLNYRAALPPVTTTGHVQALLASPTAVERETVELMRAGTLRRIVVPRRGAIGESLILSADLERLVGSSAGLDAGTKEKFVGWLQSSTTAQVMPRGANGLAGKETDDLVREGFLTAQHSGMQAAGKFARPEDRYTMISLETVARAAAGSIAAVGGADAIHAAGGTGAGGGGVAGGPDQGGVTSLSLAVPGNGSFLKLVAASLEHLQFLLEKAPFREMPESDLHERWDGGIVGDKEAALAKKSRGDFVGVLPGRTKKWRDFNGLSFYWVLEEAVGAGLVEVFETRSVGRGVRLL